MNKQSFFPLFFIIYYLFFIIVSLFVIVCSLLFFVFSLCFIIFHCCSLFFLYFSSLFIVFSLFFHCFFNVFQHCFKILRRVQQAERSRLRGINYENETACCFFQHYIIYIYIFMAYILLHVIFQARGPFQLGAQLPKELASIFSVPAWLS